MAKEQTGAGNTSQTVPTPELEVVPRLEVHSPSKGEAMGKEAAQREGQPDRGLQGAQSRAFGVGTLSDPAVPVSCGAGRQGPSASAPARLGLPGSLTN